MTEKERFGKYEIIRKLGGGISDVYLAHDPVLGRPVALKIIKDLGDASTQLVIEAEKRGAHIQRQLAGCDRILEVYESGEQNGSYFAALEYFPGRTLADTLSVERRLDARRAARYTAEICSQLQILHEFTCPEDSRKRAVVHGDIKPSNIQIGANDQLRILDFGIAKFITSGRDLTRHQLGSPGYCSPERLRDSQVDVHCDIWAAGVCLYEMLAGSPPFQAQDTRKLEDLIQSRKPMSALPADCPVELVQIVEKALAPDLDCRYPSAEAFGSDLLAFLENRSTQAAQEKVPHRKANATIFRTPAQLPLKSARAAFARRVRVRVHKNSPREVTNLTIALLAGVLCGLVLFLPATRYFQIQEIRRSLAQRKDYVLLPASVLATDWQSYQTAKHRGLWWPRFSPNDDIEDGFRANLLDSANNLIGRFRRSSDDQPSDFDWSRARLCLLYALEIDALNTRARGQLHLCDGYLSLADRQASGAYTIEAFRRASALMPRSPDPHLGLARAYVYRVRNIGMALAEFHQAAQLGYPLGPREKEQEADGYLLRGEAELNLAKRSPPGSQEDAARWLRLARGDISRAEDLYEPITGFSHVEVSLEQVYRDQDDQAKLEQALFTPPPPKSHLILLKARFVKHPVSFRWR